MEPTFSPRRVARAIGVSESSLKRWADDGRLSVHRTVGGHRRIHRAEALRFVREAGLQVRRPDLLGLPNPSVPTDGSGRAREGGDPAATLYDLLTACHPRGVHAFLLDLYMSGMPVAAICDGPIREAMSRIGELWKCERERGIVVEHRATSALLQGVASLRSVVTHAPQEGLEHRVRPVVLGGSPTGDPYLMPSILTAWVLAEAGFADINLGPETPAEAFVSAIDDHKPAIAWIACSVPDARPSTNDLKDVLKALAPHGGSLVIGGRGFSADPPPPLPRMSFCATMSDIHGFTAALRELDAAPGN
ncbi:helix-turn-helix domain-containing protein [Phycisphaera mikurensis]|uniref:B12-binding domain-containing protein n=1 Tax=Phycisphaera mikurensis (strain NBRC 102666 / KCTC 22515 / FYK2301M01) TaxID=1142394 RepID=I0IHH6_PHYMF|nr:helix-turn-helix domain-containing protein [Phycisphaera mikurensis]MBB6440961.1 excisionase family DNA binding protein [Phycisphaera mikurensis]BAM04714.1 hypothetical protein PSMK_25550 [Phycisphaera mikurensis NBRC 102666]